MGAAEATVPEQPEAQPGAGAEVPPTSPEQRTAQAEAKHQAMIRKGIYEMYVTRPLHSLKNRVNMCGLDASFYGKDKVSMADAVIENSNPAEMVNELKHDLGMLGITSLATNNAQLAAQVEYALQLRADRETAHQAALAAKKQQQEEEDEAQRQADKAERIRQAQ